MSADVKDRADTRKARPTWRPSRRAQWAVVAAMMVFVAVVRAAAPEERDPYWSARAGIDTMNGLPLSRPEVWSWSAPGGIWFQNSPAWNVLLGLSWQGAGFWGLFLVAFISISALLAIAWVLARRLGARPMPGLAGVMLGLFAAWPMLSARATVVVQTLLLAAVWFGWWAGPRLARKPTWLAALIVAAVGLAGSIAGNWVHLSFTVMAGAVAFMWAIQWLSVQGASWQWKATLTVAGTAGLFAGVLTTPYGLAETLRQSRSTQEACAGLIGEWAAVWEVHPIWVIRALIALAVGIAGAWWLWRLWQEKRAGSDSFRITAPLVALGLPTALAGVPMLRFVGVSLLVLLPLFAVGATRVADRVQRRTAAATTGWMAGARAAEYTGSALWVRTMALAAVPLAVFAGFTARAGARPPEQDLIDVLPANCQLYTPDPAASGSVILTRPDVKVWMDGRADYYGRDLLIRNYRIIAGYEPIPAGTSCVLMRERSYDFPLAAERLGADPAWQPFGARNGFILWVPAGTVDR